MRCARRGAARACRRAAGRRGHADPAEGVTAPAAAASEVLIEGGSLIDGTGAPPRPLGALLLRGDRIAAVGAAAAAQASAAAVRISAAGKSVMPGLIDAHCHCTFAEPQSNDELFFHRREGLCALVAGWQMQKILRAGVTGILDADVLYNLGVDVRDAIEMGVIAGPRMATGGRALLTAVGGTSGNITPNSGGLGYAQICNSKDEMVTTVRRQIKGGVDWIKIHGTGLVPRSRLRGEVCVWTQDEIRTVVETAHDLGVPVVIHCRNAKSTYDAAEAGVDLILHATHMDGQALDAIVKHNVPICPTLTFQANVAEYGHKVGTTPALIEMFRKEIVDSSEMLSKAHQAGVPFLIGSESGFSLTPYGHWHARELRILVEHVGMTPLEAIRCGTMNGGRVLNLDGQVGVVKEGALADVIVVDGDPSQDVSVLEDRRNITAVIARGRPVDLSAPWPERGRMPDEKIANWTEGPLTYERATAA